jgi:hypothetical protein
MIGAIAGAVVGGLFANRAASKQAAAMQQQGAAQLEAARIAAEEARFRPVGITTRFASATPQFTGGRLSGYSYEAAPELKALQNQLSGIYGPSLLQAEQAAAAMPQFQQAAQGLFALGQAEVPQSREQILQQQRDLLRPYDIEQEQRLAAGVFGRGRGGLNLSVGGQPELQALAESRRRRDLEMLANVDQTFMNRAAQAAGLFGQGAGLLGTGYQMQQAALSPFQSQFQLATQLEDVARQPMDIGTALGQKVTSANARAGELMGQGMSAAANLQSQAAQAKASGLASLGQGIAGLGRQYDQNVLFDEWMNRAFPTTQTPAPIGEIAVDPFGAASARAARGMSPSYNTYQPWYTQR